MRSHRRLGALPSFAVLTFVLAAIGCRGLEYTPQNRAMFMPRELPAADRAIAAARAAGKAQQCPDAFLAVEKLRDEAYTTFWACRTQESIAMANDAAAKAAALCPPVARAAAPTVSIAASPASIEQGRCTTLRWTSTNASTATIDQGLGAVATAGSREVCPATTTRYTIVASGAGGSPSAATTVTVTPAPKVVSRVTIRINFDFDKSDIRPADIPELQKALDFVKQHGAYRISVEGHTDDRGTDEYNQALSMRRATAVKTWLVQHGVNGDRLTPVGHGESRPIASNATDEGRFQNRRVELLAISE